jgi:K+-sensing histidine kinase KdpD
VAPGKKQKNKIMITHFAPPERSVKAKILEDYTELKSTSYIEELIDALPYIAVILNQQREIVFSNSTLLKLMGIEDMEELLGQRPGEALNCIHSDKMEAGCGTAENCQVCGAANAILKCQESGEKVTDECRIRTFHDGVEDCLDLEVTAAPLIWGKSRFSIFTARDISSKKRKEALERIFFHDVMNTAGTLQGVVDLLKQIDDPLKINQFINILDEVSRDLTEEIMTQKSLVAAENGELVVKNHEFYLRETMGHIIAEYRRHKLGLEREIIFEENTGDQIINTDPVLLKRILGNMIKNALEAVPVGGKVRVDFNTGKEAVTIHVRNPGHMPKDVKQQVFQRSFSTKGTGRGLGTYSMKLLGERFLHGKVSFESSPASGTVFSLELPLH